MKYVLENRIDEVLATRPSLDGTHIRRLIKHSDSTTEWEFESVRTGQIFCDKSMRVAYRLMREFEASS